MWPFLNISGLSGEEIPAQATFKTTANGAVSFSLSKTGAAVTWDMGDGTIYSSTNSVAHVYGDASEKTVKIYADDPDLITAFGTLENLNITYIDFSLLNGLGGVFNANTNAGLTQALMPTASTNPFTDFRIESCDLTGNLDLSGCIIQGIFRVRVNPNLTSITHSTNATQFSTFYFASDNDLTGTHNLSNVECRTTFTIANNSNMTGITLKNTSVATAINFSGNNLLTLDVSGINLSGNFYVYGNSNLTSITHAANVASIGSYRAYDCNLTGTLDVSSLNISSTATFLVYNNPNLTAITHDPAHSFNAYYVYDCNLASGGTLDLSTVTIDGTGAGFRGFIASRNNFTAVTHEATAALINQYQCINGACVTFDFTKFTNWDTGLTINIQMNGLDAAQMNRVCVDLDSVLGVGSGSITLRASVSPTNASPDSSSGGLDGSAAVTSLVGKGYTVNL